MSSCQHPSGTWGGSQKQLDGGYVLKKLMGFPNDTHTNYVKEIKSYLFWPE